MFRFLMSVPLLILFVVSIPGCGSPRSERPKPSLNSVVQWEQGKEFVENETVSILLTSISANSWKEVSEIAKDPALKSAVEKFESAELPEELSSKKTAKTDLIQKLKILIEDANAGGKNKIAEAGKGLKVSYERFLKNE